MSRTPPSAASRIALLRPLVGMLLLALLASGCSGPDDPEPGPTAEAVDGVFEEDPLLPELQGEAADAVEYCALGAADWCAFLGPQLDGAQLQAVDDRCAGGTDQACRLAENLTTAGFTVEGADGTGGGGAVDPDATAVPGEVPQPAAPLLLSANGLLVTETSTILRFRDEVESVIAVLAPVLGPPVEDTGVGAPDSAAGCPGSQARTVRWPGLELTFLDQSPHRDDGVLHLAEATVLAESTQVFGVVEGGGRLVLEPGVTTVADLQAEADVEVRDDEVRGPRYEVSIAGFADVSGQLSATTGDGTVQTVSAGRSCEG